MKKIQRCLLPCQDKTQEPWADRWVELNIEFSSFMVYLTLSSLSNYIKRFSLYPCGSFTNQSFKNSLLTKKYYSIFLRQEKRKVRSLLFYDDKVKAFYQAVFPVCRWKLCTHQMWRERKCFLKTHMYYSKNLVT